MSLVSQAHRQAGAAIAAHANEIAQGWRDAVRADDAIAGDEGLPDLLLTNQVPALLADKGLPVRSIEPVRPSLEDVFVALVRREGGAVLG